MFLFFFFFFSSRRRHTRLQGDWSSDVCSSDLGRERAFCGVKLCASASPLASVLRRWHPRRSASCWARSFKSGWPRRWLTLLECAPTAPKSAGLPPPPGNTFRTAPGWNATCYLLPPIGGGNLGGRVG